MKTWRNTTSFPKPLRMFDNPNHIGVIGIGKLGLCFALNLDLAGFEVTALDKNAAYVDEVNARTLKSHEPQVEEMLANAGNVYATTDMQEFLASGVHLIFVVVATPSLPDGSYDHSQVDALAAALEAAAPGRPLHLVIMCTTMPGYCDCLAERLAPLDIAVSYNPEFIAQGTVVRDQQYPDQILIGEANEAAGNAIEEVYRRMVHNEPAYCRMSRISAEIAKIATNCFLTTKISFANSIGDLATKVGAEPDKILAAIGSDQRIGPRYLRYGFGYGGPCFPRDNRALGIYGEREGFPVLISEATDAVNRQHLDFQFEQYLAQHAPEDVITFEHVTYKPGTTILEESQQLALAVKLAQAGRKVLVREHPAVIEELKAQYGDLFSYEAHG